MERTIEELERLLVERALVGRMLREEPGTDPGADYLITDTDFFPLSMLAVLKFDTDDCAFTLKDLGKLLDGQKVRGMGKWWNKAYTLLPAEEPTEEEPADEPTTEPAVPTEQPAKPALTEQWRKRWWQFFYHYIAADGCDAEEAALRADRSIEVARKHLEGE